MHTDVNVLRAVYQIRRDDLIRAQEARDEQARDVHALEIRVAREQATLTALNTVAEDYEIAVRDAERDLDLALTVKDEDFAEAHQA